MTSSNENIFRVTGLLWGESTGQRWVPLTKASDAELWCFLRPAPEHAEQTVKQIIESQVIWDAIALIMMWLYCACRMLCELISKTLVHNIALTAGHHVKSRRERLCSGKDRNHDPSLHEDCNRLALISACASHRLCRQVLDNKKSQSEFEGRKWVNCTVCYRCKRNMMVAHVLA